MAHLRQKKAACSVSWGGKSITFVVEETFCGGREHPTLRDQRLTTRLLPIEP